MGPIAGRSGSHKWAPMSTDSGLFGGCGCGTWEGDLGPLGWWNSGAGSEDWHINSYFDVQYCTVCGIDFPSKPATRNVILIRWSQSAQSHSKFLRHKNLQCCQIVASDSSAFGSTSLDSNVVCCMLVLTVLESRMNDSSGQLWRLQLGIESLRKSSFWRPCRHGHRTITAKLEFLLKACFCTCDFPDSIYRASVVSFIDFTAWVLPGLSWKLWFLWNYWEVNSSGIYLSR